MTKIFRTMGKLSLILGVLTLIRSRSALIGGILWIPKVLAEAASPFLAVIGALSSLVGFATGDWKTGLNGLIGASIARRHIIRVTKQHDGFESAFGAEWESRIPSHMRDKMLKSRWAPFVTGETKAPWRKDIGIGMHVESGDPILADLWLPPESSSRTGMGVIYLHGSGWHFSDKDKRTRSFFQHIVRQGHVILDVAYTMAPKADLRAMLADVRRAIQWMKSEGASYGVDPNRIVLMGGSAGAHLALLSAYTSTDPMFQTPDVEGDTQVRAVVSYYGPPDLVAMQEHFEENFRVIPDRDDLSFDRVIGKIEDIARRSRVLPSYGRLISPTQLIPDLVGGSLEDCEEEYVIGSPINHVGPHCPPTLLLQGAHDFAITAENVRNLHHALIDAGATSIYVEFPNTDHSFDVFMPKWSPARQAALYDVERFLALMM
ncbi:MAG: alpha/beta hydrolase fold domain-containing protein [Anaerolineales bacterium]|nr:alpha/beta hydrolase fold domain-containing protein [Anaerolineales bacterium]